MVFCSGGLTGIKFMFTNSVSSGWVGDSNSPGIVQGTLRIPKRISQNFMFAGLDRFKIISLSLGEFIGNHPPAFLQFPFPRVRIPFVDTTSLKSQGFENQHSPTIPAFQGF